MLLQVVHKSVCGTHNLIQNTVYQQNLRSGRHNDIYYGAKI